MTTIGLIDNFIIIRLGLALILNQKFQDMELLEAEDLESFEKLQSQKTPDVFILGNNASSRQECFATVAAFREHYPNTPIIVYDEHSKQNMVIPYFELGVKGYILKQNIADEMVNAVNSVQQDRPFLCPTLVENLLGFIAKKQHHLTNPALLTPRESEIAKYLTQGMKTSWIAKALGRKPSTISTIKHNIFVKMKVENIVELKKVYLEELTI
ncbi:DNA-binding NarL/FixJ family response regulator [Dyadobacter jejuensis]|uniref:DNA-binding NarL/FixJ family response regulator n=1 Tax=Dyadobacter jejuensis TaxID=1082580 RepID=A0A316AI08_9BACT|nr:response regulator transcription factor [Dyadobacter jejuensis]PWJ56918.1 DNA-binding NarL/FixJ family response regulator [Dyadobacter jejuensis]